MVPELRNQQRISNHFVDDAVLIVDAPRPIARERMPQGFWLTNATEGITLNPKRSTGLGNLANS